MLKARRHLRLCTSRGTRLPDVPERLVDVCSHLLEEAERLSGHVGQVADEALRIQFAIECIADEGNLADRWAHVARATGFDKLELVLGDMLSALEPVSAGRRPECA